MTTIKVSKEVLDKLVQIVPEGSWNDRISFFIDFHSKPTSEIASKPLVNHRRAPSIDEIWNEIKPKVENLFYLLIEEAKRDY